MQTDETNIQAHIPQDPLLLVKKNPFNMVDIIYNYFLDFILVVIIFKSLREDYDLKFKVIKIILPAYSFLINYFPHKLKQNIAISMTNILILATQLKGNLNVIAIYIAALPQVVRMEKYRKIYLFLRQVRITSGPIYGIILLWRILLEQSDAKNFDIKNNTFSINRKNSILFVAFSLFNIGVCLRPEAGENYFKRRKLHGIFMVLSFFTMMVFDFINLYLYYI